MNVKRSFVLLITVSSIFLLTISPVAASDPQVTVDYWGNPGGDCKIEVNVNNLGGDSVVVHDVKVVLLLPFNLNSSIFNDLNVTYAVFSGEKNIPSGSEIAFTKKATMPDWDIIQFGIEVKAYVNLTINDGAAQTIVASNSMEPLESSGFGGLDLNFNYIWLIPPGVFILGMLGFIAQYYNDKPYWDIWVKEKFDDRRTNLFMRWRWLQMKWMDEGNGTNVVIIWVGVSLAFAVVIAIMIAQIV